MKITQEQLRKIEAANRRRDLIEGGIALLPANKVHRLKKAWKRKPKHQTDYE